MKCFNVLEYTHVPLSDYDKILTIIKGFEDVQTGSESQDELLHIISKSMSVPENNDSRRYVFIASIPNQPLFFVKDTEDDSYLSMFGLLIDDVEGNVYSYIWDKTGDEDAILMLDNQMVSFFNTEAYDDVRARGLWMLEPTRKLLEPIRDDTNFVYIGSNLASSDVSEHYYIRKV